MVDHRQIPPSKTTMVAGDIANMTNGVSQQPQNIRFTSQAEAVVNFLPTVQDQCAQRNPLESLFILEDFAEKVVAGQPTGLLLTLTQSIWPKMHWYRRDTNEFYVFLINGRGSIYAYNVLTGESVPVDSGPANSSIVTYLTSETPVDDFFLYTYKDTTFIVNRSVVTRMSPLPEVAGVAQGGLLLALSLTALHTRNPEAIIVVDDATTDFTYSGTITIGSATPITFSKTAVSGDDVNDVASAIKTSIEAAVTSAGGASAVKGNVVHVSHPTDLITVEVEDNRSGTAIHSFTDNVLKEVDLPTYAPNGYLAQVSGSSSDQNAQNFNEADDIWYRFETDGGSSFAAGVWKETVDPTVRRILDPSTMPHRITRLADGTFQVRPIEWDNREVGDDLTNPEPEFIDQTIHSIFQTNNRLGLVTGGAFQTSRTEEVEYYNFWKTTTTTSLDTDPVRGVIPSTRVNKAYHAIQWNGEIMIFGDSVDAAVSWNNTFSQNNISIDTPTNFGASPLVAPVLSGSSLFYTKDRGNYSLLYEYQIDPVTSLKTAENLTEYASNYIPKRVIELTATSADFVLMFSDQDRHKLYPYNYSRRQNRLLQQAFHLWDFSSKITIVSHYIDKDTVYLIYQLGEKFFLGKIELSSGAKDTNYTRKCCLDGRITETLPGVVVSYDEVTDRTTVSLPFKLSNPTEGVRQLEIRETYTEPQTGSTYPPGKVLTEEVESGSETEMVFVGDWSSSKWFCGLINSAYYDTIELQAYRANASEGGSSKVSDTWKKIMVKHVNISFSQAMFFEVKVVNVKTGEEESLGTYSPVQLDNRYTQLDDNSLRSGTYSILMNRLASEWRLRLVNPTSKPVTFTQISWRGNFSGIQ